MPGPFRSTTMRLGALLLAGQAGCALAPGSGSEHQATASMATAVPATAPTGFDADPAGSAAPSNLVALHHAGSGAPTDSFSPGYSNTYIGETLGQYGLPVFAVADYYDWGGYPVYYPYPYVIGPGSSVDPWSNSYSSWSRYSGPYAAYNRGLVATAGGERGIVSSKGRRVATGTRAKADDARSAQAGFAHRPEPSSGRQYRSGNPSSSKGSGRSSGSYAAGQNGGSQASRGARSGGYRGSGRGYRTRPSDMKGSYSFRRGLAGFRRTGPRL